MYCSSNNLYLDILALVERIWLILIWMWLHLVWEEFDHILEFAWSVQPLELLMLLFKVEWLVIYLRCAQNLCSPSLLVWLYQGL
ncbi:equilibrative nucleotide transporter 3-like [Iris pallida]|uniref:Equilibrative nucleotide transporter 3-like n=1 Tax=Iris pallida TaxID=29817 RepID=A0AAX6GR50_IRIPA|nr:equilibrative nucleotide transporter 3-like [Iris pallida]